jgi:hypothetical protein
LNLKPAIQLQTCWLCSAWLLGECPIASKQRLDPNIIAFEQLDLGHRIEQQ